MKKIVLGILLILLNLQIKAQSYIPLLRSNQTWEQFQSWTASICGWDAGQILTVGDDTLITGQYYSKIICHPIKAVNQGPFCQPFIRNDSIKYIQCYLREDTALGKVFLYDTLQQNEYVLYDFNVQDGDTLFNYVMPPPYIFIVDSVRSINYPGIGSRKTYYINSQASISPYNFYIEGIGCKHGLDYPLFEAIGAQQFLTCVRDSLNSPLYGTCISGFVGTEELASNGNYNFAIKSNAYCLSSAKPDEVYDIVIYNSIGQIIFKEINLKTNVNYFFNMNFENMLIIYSITLPKYTLHLKNKIYIH